MWRPQHGGARRGLDKWKCTSSRSAAPQYSTPQPRDQIRDSICQDSLLHFSSGRKSGKSVFVVKGYLLEMDRDEILVLLPPEGEGAWISTFVLVSLPSTLPINGALMNRAWSGNRSSEGRPLACGLHSDPALTHIHNLFTSHNPFNLFHICRATSVRVRHNVLAVIHLSHASI